MRSLLPPLLALLLFAGGRAVHGQEMRREAIPFSVWLDFDALSSAHPPLVSLPIWLESLRAEPSQSRPGFPEQTVFRLRLRHVGDLNREMEMRVFFEDLPGANPTVTGWTETGQGRYQSGPLGTGVGLPNSETLIIPVSDLDYLDITVPGDGRTIRGIFLSSVKLSQARFSLDFQPSSAFTEPFGSPSAAPPSNFDRYLMGRVSAVIEEGPLRVTSETPASWNVQLDRKPDFAVLNFEVLNADLANPPAVGVNGAALGPVTLQLPDLADPAYRGTIMPHELDQRVHYTGWMRAQRIVPASALQSGLNEFDLVVGRQTTAVAIRGVELQLKYPADDPSNSH